MTDEELLEEIKKRFNSQTDIFLATEKEYLVVTLEEYLNYQLPIMKNMRFLI
ncbi:MAG: hypothetical protein NC191_03745 [Muribaculaceae bacterium]|nr:hypothetical protein [Muribaculaceae bacterium]